MEVAMRIMISAEDNGKAILSITLTFKEQEEGVAVARMLETFARNWWLSSQDEQARTLLWRVLTGRRLSDKTLCQPARLTDLNFAAVRGFSMSDKAFMDFLKGVKRAS